MKRINLILIGLLIWAIGYGQELGFKEELKNKLVPYEEQINMYKEKIDSIKFFGYRTLFGYVKCSKISDFKMVCPYVIVTLEEEKIKDLIGYSESNIPTIDQVKMVIFKYDILKNTVGYVVVENTFNPIKNHQYAGSKSTYNAILIYFDMDRKECVGYDEVAAPELHSNYSSDNFKGDLFVSSKEINDRIRYRSGFYEYQKENHDRFEGTWSGKVKIKNKDYPVHYTFEGKRLKYEQVITKKRSTVYEGCVTYDEKAIIFTPEKVVFKGKKNKKSLFFLGFTKEDYLRNDMVLYYILTDNEFHVNSTHNGFFSEMEGHFHKIE